MTERLKDTCEIEFLAGRRRGMADAIDAALAAYDKQISAQPGDSSAEDIRDVMLYAMHIARNKLK